MRTLLLISGFLLWQHLQAQSVDWAFQANSTGSSTGKKICNDGAGNILVAGTANAGATICGHALNGGDFVAKFSNAGNCLWAKNIPGKIADLAADNSGNVYLAGTFSGAVSFSSATLNSAGMKDLYLTKLDAAGNFTWAKQAGSVQDDNVNALAVDAQGNSYITGSFPATIFFDTLHINAVSTVNAFLVKYNTNGNAEWTHSAATTTSPYGNGSQLCAFDVIAGNAAVRWICGYTGSVTVEDTSFSNYYTSVFFFSCDQNNAQKSICERRYDKGTEIKNAFENNSEMYWSGNTGSQYGHWEVVNRHDSLMNIIWSANLCHPNWCSTSVVAAGMSGAGGVYALCNFTDHDSYDMNNINNWVASNGANDFFLVKYDASGAYQWRTHWGGTGNDISRSLLVDNYGNCYITGSFTDTLNMDAAQLHASGDSTCFFIAKIGSSPANNATAIKPVKKENTFTVFPNPTAGLFTIASGNSELKEVRIYNLKGEVINSFSFSSENKSLDLSAYTKGIYLVELTRKQERSTVRIVIE